MRCERIKEWMGDRLDGCLDADRTWEMDEHLAGCEVCRREWAEIHQTVSLLHDLPPVEPPADLLPTVRRRLAQPRQAPWVVCWHVLSLPQTRVAVAASLVVVLGIYGWQAMSAGQARLPDLPAASSRSAIPDRPKHAQGIGDASVASVSQIQILDVRRELAADKSPADKRTPAEPSLSKDRETKGRIWNKQDVAEETDHKEKVVGGLTVGSATPLAGASDGHANRPALARDESSVSVSETIPAPMAVAARQAPQAAQPVAEVPAARNATAKTLGFSALTPKPDGEQRLCRDREIVMAANDAAAVRKVLAQYAVPEEKLKADNVRAREAMRRIDPTNEKDIPITGWVPAARYAQLIAGLQAVGTVKVLPGTGYKRAAGDSEDASWIKRGQSCNDSADPIFVQITVIPPEK